MPVPPTGHLLARSVETVTNNSEVREFLKSRRARITPDVAGLTVYGGLRRVPGLRREELAMIAGMSIDYYNRLERGNLTGVSDSILESLARALKLDDAERTYLFDLARCSIQWTNPDPGNHCRKSHPHEYDIKYHTRELG